ncbi:hypothetical protein PROFUN_07034 [Planoprotostelium fungivorum]|uniref:Uncharacterized protein n=1 Tax=Planoprotostelium fungivorum TaxID=1890364 RepID=A0A2P6NMR7_9EUKA|nr:hypothetical protein PROFUN_07034 [Planoprotostelium fungivorum]
MPSSIGAQNPRLSRILYCIATTVSFNLTGSVNRPKASGLNNLALHHQ